MKNDALNTEESLIQLFYPINRDIWKGCAPQESKSADDWHILKETEPCFPLAALQQAISFTASTSNTHPCQAVCHQVGGGCCVSLASRSAATKCSPVAYKCFVSDQGGQRGTKLTSTSENKSPAGRTLIQDTPGSLPRLFSPIPWYTHRPYALPNSIRRYTVDTTLYSELMENGKANNWI